MNQPIGIRCQLNDSAVIARLADAAARRIMRRTIRALQRMTDGLHSGDHSGLTNAWEEYCVQVQGEESVSWETFEKVVHIFVETEIQELPQHEVVALWFQTDKGEDWRWEDDQEERDHMVIEYNLVAEYVMNRYVYSAAEKWSNRRIRNYLARRYA